MLVLASGHGTAELSVGPTAHYTTDQQLGGSHITRFSTRRNLRLVSLVSDLRFAMKTGFGLPNRSRFAACLSSFGYL
ncbi:hypothetical protein SRHO_G00224140 [Serrasalmus rhombeus]